jgi:hypothetical protein
VSFTIGVYDLFTYATPGSLYLAIGLYVAARLEWVELGDLAGHGALTLVVALASYLLGHVTYGMTRALDRFGVWRWPLKHLSDAREEFRARNEHLEPRPYVDLDKGVLLAAAEIHAQEGALEITRLKAVALMLSGCAPALLVAAAVAAVEIVTSGQPAFALVAMALLAASALAAIGQSRRLTHWSNLKTFETAFWIPGIDDPGSTR